jgi:hypothetical protein
MDTEKLIAEAKKLFPAKDRPKKFILDFNDFESDEHEEVLQKFDEDSIGLGQLENLCLTPISDISWEGYKYYFPAFVRLAVNEINQQEYPEYTDGIFLIELNNIKRVKYFSDEQKLFVQKLLLEMLNSLSEKNRNIFEPDFLNVLKTWGWEK